MMPAGALALPIFHPIHADTRPSRVALVVMFVALALYYLGWVRYFAHGRRPALLYEPLFEVPLPLAVAPIALLLAASVAQRSIWLGAAAATFGAAHLALTSQEWRRCRSTPPP
jgi:hypothetical protein